MVHPFKLLLNMNSVFHTNTMAKRWLETWVCYCYKTFVDLHSSNISSTFKKKKSYCTFFFLAITRVFLHYYFFLYMSIFNVVFVWCHLLFEGKREDKLESVYYVRLRWITNEWKQWFARCITFTISPNVSKFETINRAKTILPCVILYKQAEQCNMVDIYKMWMLMEKTLVVYNGVGIHAWSPVVHEVWRGRK